MLTKGVISGAVFGVAMAFSAAVSNAAVIDFTSASTGHTGTIAGSLVTWSMTSNGVLNNSQAFDGSTAPSVPGLSFQTDGYGVGKNDDEITTTATKQEWINVSFSAPVLVNAFYFLDLFISKDLQTWELLKLRSTAARRIRSPRPTLSLATRKTVLRASLASRSSRSTQRRSASPFSSNDAYGFADGALAGIGLAPIPVPAAGALMLGGLGGLAALRRRKKAA